MSWLSHAFAVDPPGPAVPTAEQREAVDWLCREIVRRGLATPSQLFLEMTRPLNYLEAQAMHFLAPGVEAITRQASYETYAHLASFLERRGSTDYLSQRIEHFEREHDQPGLTEPVASPPGDDRQHP